MSYDPVAQAAAVSAAAADRRRERVARLERFIAEAAVAGGNVEADVTEDGRSAVLRFAAAPERVYVADFDEYDEPRLRRDDAAELRRGR